MNVAPSKGINVREGFSKAYHDRVNKKNIKGFIKRGGKRALVGAGKAFGGAVLGTTALGVGVATGDLKNAATYATAGVAAGGKLGGRVATKGMNEAIRTGSAFKKGALGGNEYKTKQIITELKEDGDFSSACKAVGIDKKGQEQLIRQFINNGITKKEDILNAVLARQTYEKKHKVVRDEQGNVTQGDPNDIISDKDLIDLAIYEQSVSNHAWGTPSERDKILDGTYQKLGATPDAKKKVRRAGEIVDSIKKAQ